MRPKAIVPNGIAVGQSPLAGGGGGGGGPPQKKENQMISAMMSSAIAVDCGAMRIRWLSVGMASV